MKVKDIQTRKQKAFSITKQLSKNKYAKHELKTSIAKQAPNSDRHIYMMWRD